MKAPKFAPTAVAVALLFAAAPLIGSVGATVVTGKNAGAAAPATVAAKAKASAAAGQVHKITLKTGMAGGKMVYLDEKGNANPVLKGKVGDTLEITIASGEGAEHDIVFPELNVNSAKFSGKAVVKVSVPLTKAGKFTYLCSIPGHRQIGMEGVLEVEGPAGAAAAAAPAAVKTVALGAAAADARAIAPAAAHAVSISMDPNAVPRSPGARAPQLVKYHIETVELEGKLDDGTTFTYWTFGKKVPGPMLRVKQGDTVELTLANNPNSKAVHSIDLHSVTGGHGGGEHTQVAPGESKTIRFQVLNPGLYVYHCATPSVPHHISAGMYGMILVEPPQGLPKVDKEFYVMQGDLYTSHAYGTKGHHEYSHQRADDELPTYYTFNGAVGALGKEHKMSAKVGETVRVYFGVGGPNKVSSFHVIGEIFDKVYSEGSITTVKNDVQTTLVAPGGATIVDFKVNYPGKYILVDHALSRAGKGLSGVLEVTGPADSKIYQPLDGGKHADH
ncbi:copper-containing nitrite reductase [Ramlibacter tataouinensis]|uniref:copper-containing nitrite reductase n=1 Tax=Ramlibacter tataouinensis TaxID=94132 RepID=UPI0022F3E094|nr:copper-containing nitrite reductase [Ramlibacter tataouinensis]WBY02511.1 copper-containing nitrite reductase [Ramlibacter tataouinensis]